MIGSFLDRFGPRWVIPVGSMLIVIGLLATSRIEALWHFYLFYGVITAMGVCATGFVSHSIFLPKWFFKKRGLAIGIATSGIGVGMLVLVPVIQHVISNLGWRTAYCFLAGVVLTVIVPLNALLQRRNPEEIGEVPDGLGRPQALKESLQENPYPISWEESSLTEWTLGNILRTRRFWFLFLTYFLTPMTTQGPLIHQVVYMVDKGFSAQKGAFFFGLTGIMGSVGKILFGHFSDKVGREKVFSIGMGCTFLGILSLMAIQPDYNVLLYGYAILFGLGYGSVAPIYPSRAADLFAGPQFGKTFGLLAIAGGVGGGIGTWMYGKIFDMTASYKISFVIVLFLLILIVVLFWFTSPSSPKEGGTLHYKRDAEPPV